MDDDIETYESTDAGASLTIPIQAGAIKKGAMVVLKGYPCKVSNSDVVSGRGNINIENWQAWSR